MKISQESHRGTDKHTASSDSEKSHESQITYLSEREENRKIMKTTYYSAGRQ